MAENTLNGLRVAILATDGFEQIELVAPRTALENAGAKTTLIAPKSGSIYGMQHHNSRNDRFVRGVMRGAQSALTGGIVSLGIRRRGDGKDSGHRLPLQSSGMPR